MKDVTYLPRIIDRELNMLLQLAGAVQIKGPKWCGKTMTGENHCASKIFLQDPDYSADYLALADIKPSQLLEGEKPRLIDEWQMAPQLWDAVRIAVDRSSERGSFILTASSTPTVTPAHSGVGRIARLDMRTMSLFETGESNGAVSLAALFEKSTDIAALSSLDINDIAHAVCRGGWPEAITIGAPKLALRLASLYVDELIDSDVSRMDGVSRNSTRMRALMRSYARNISTEASTTTIQADMQESEATLSYNTVNDYLDALSRAYVIEDVSAWNPSLRSKTAIRTSSTRHFTDPSIAVALLGLSPEKLLLDFATFGLLFESLCVHDLRIYARALDGELYHYRDKTGLESDAVIVLRDGRWAAVEVKLGQKDVDEGARHLLALRDRVDTSKLGEPEFLMIITGTQTAYQRPDGVFLVPLGCLKP